MPDPMTPDEGSIPAPDASATVSGGDAPTPRPNRCVACGEITARGRWCSESCRRAEDGLSADEERELERDDEDDDR